MSIKAYVGRMGSGKSYEVVSVVILSALRRGRRVVSNIAGLNHAEMVALLELEGVAVEHVGELVSVDHDAVLAPEFWRADDNQDAFVQPGDLLVLDEVWRFWEGFSGRKMPASVMNFFRMHRHFTHPETGVSCDVVLISQDIMDMARRVRAVIEESYRMEKLTAVGSTKRYRVDIFMGGKTSGKPLRQLHRSYDPRYFVLYSSHSQRKEGDAEAKEENVDGRGNILKGAIVKVVLPVMTLVFVVAVVGVWRFFHPDDKKTDSNLSKTTAGASEHAGRTPAPVERPDESDSWRVVGYFDLGGGMHFLLGNEHRHRVINPPSYKITAWTSETFLPSGEAVTSWSGGVGRRGMIEKAAGE